LAVLGVVVAAGDGKLCACAGLANNIDALQKVIAHSTEILMLFGTPTP
jgi:hypothetical protein